MCVCVNPPVVFIQVMWYSALTSCICFTFRHIDSLEVEGIFHSQDLFKNQSLKSKCGPGTPPGKLTMLVCHVMITVYNSDSVTPCLSFCIALV